MKCSPTLIVVALIACTAPRAFAQRPDTVVHTRALSGQPAPGTIGDTFVSFGAPHIDASGRVLFPATLPGSPPGAADGVWVQALDDQPHLVARRGDPAPGAPGHRFASFRSWAVDNPSSVSIGATTDRGLTGLWASRLAVTLPIPPLDLGLLAMQGAPAPGTGDGSTFASFSAPRRNGTVFAFRAGTDSPGGRQTGIWWGAQGALQPAARTGDPAPGAGGARFASLSDPALFFGNPGGLAFQAALDSPGLPDQGIWWGTPGALQIAHRSGAPAPGAAGAVFDTFDAPQATMGAGIGAPTRNLAYRATLRGDGVGAGNDVGVYSGLAGAAALVARTGDPTPGLGGTVFAQLGSPDLASSADTVAFLARLGGPAVAAANDDSVWATFPDTGSTRRLRMLAREGAAAPGAPGASFASFEQAAAAWTSHLFVATLSGPGVDSSNDRGVWVAPLFSPDPVLLLREGDLLPVAPGDVRRIERLLLAPSRAEGGLDSGWSESGDSFAFAADFTDGTSGVFRLIYVGVPDPAALPVLAVAALAALARLRRRVTPT